MCNPKIVANPILSIKLWQFLKHHFLASKSGWKRGREIQPKTSFKNQPQGLTDADLRI